LKRFVKNFTSLDMDSERIFFCSFADKRLAKSLSRIENQARELHFFDKIIIFNENDLDRRFREKHKQILNARTNGFGYWIWKPKVILQTLDQMDFGDSLLYLDAGSHLNKEGLSALHSYFVHIKESPAGILATHLGSNLQERRWTKGDVFEYFNCKHDCLITDTPQIQAGLIFLNKRTETVNLINRWMEIAENHNLIDNSPSRTVNLSDFISHRNDQSIFSILCKINKVDTISTSRFWTKGDWNDLMDQPIWLKHDKQFKQNILKRAITFIYRNLILRKKMRLFL
jgi:hypothetical protein